MNLPCSVVVWAERATEANDSRRQQREERFIDVLEYASLMAFLNIGMSRCMQRFLSIPPNLPNCARFIDHHIGVQTSMTESPTVQPVRTLREHVTALEAAMMVCLADPRPRAVHRLRTMTRRIEGQLALLAMLPASLCKQSAKKLRRILKKFRRAAGEVRDLDVQVDLIDGVESASPSKSSFTTLRGSVP